jgi:aspartyl/asparaginyl beta-hydroxylase (cupin superfamily)
VTFAVFNPSQYDFQAEWLQSLLKELEWEAPPNRYHTADVSHLFPGYKRAFFLKLPPGTGIHRHVDCGDCNTDHIVVQTNPQCLNWWIEDGEEKSMHMEQGKRYTVDRTCVHWAENNGPTDRIHLLLEY